MSTGITIAATSATMSPLIILSTSKCPRCGIFKKSGQVSCCAPGGAWYKKCAKERESKGNSYTWLEGFEACVNAAEESQAHGMPPQQTDITQRTFDSTTWSDDNADVQNAQAHDNLSAVTVFISISLFNIFIM